MIRLFNEDCMEYMATLKDNSFDLAVVDPPYGMIGLGAKKGGKNFLQKSMGKMQNRAFNRGALGHWDISPNQEYFDQLLRVSKHQIIWGGQYFTDKLPASREWITWDKCQPWQNFSQVELAWTSFKGTTKLFKYDNRYSGKIHPTQKPVALYQWIFDNYAKKGMKILDTHLGSGSSAIAAHDSGLDFVGIELDSDYFKAAKERLETHQRQLQLFR
jgi:site-specific DNA-methyltransferase (adenine-specific)